MTSAPLCVCDDKCTAHAPLAVYARLTIVQRVLDRPDCSHRHHASSSQPPSSVNCHRHHQPPPLPSPPQPPQPPHLLQQYQATTAPRQPMVVLLGVVKVALQNSTGFILDMISNDLSFLFDSARVFRMHLSPEVPFECILPCKSARDSEKFGFQ